MYLARRVRVSCAIPHCLDALPSLKPLDSPTLVAIREQLTAMADPARAANLQRYFKTAPGEYAAGDEFIGVTVPELRRIARQLRGASLQLLVELLRSPLHEERLLALLGLVDAYTRNPGKRDEIHQAYMSNRSFVNNWDLVDTSAPTLVGAHLPISDVDLLLALARSPVVWDRRIAVIATLHDIRAGNMSRIELVARFLLDDPHDLIRKATGWMLREMGNRAPELHRRFLHDHAARMPRTMLRYAIEKLPVEERRWYLARKSNAPGS